MFACPEESRTSSQDYVALLHEPLFSFAASCPLVLTAHYLSLKGRVWMELTGL